MIHSIRKLRSLDIKSTYFDRTGTSPPISFLQSLTPALEYLKLDLPFTDLFSIDRGTILGSDSASHVDFDSEGYDDIEVFEVSAPPPAFDIGAVLPKLTSLLLPQVTLQRKEVSFLPSSLTVLEIAAIPDDCILLLPRNLLHFKCTSNPLFQLTASNAAEFPPELLTIDMYLDPNVSESALKALPKTLERLQAVRFSWMREWSDFLPNIRSMRIDTHELSTALACLPKQLTHLDWVVANVSRPALSCLPSSLTSLNITSIAWDEFEKCEDFSPQLGSLVLQTAQNNQNVAKLLPRSLTSLEVYDFPYIGNSISQLPQGLRTLLMSLGLDHQYPGGVSFEDPFPSSLNQLIFLNGIWHTQSLAVNQHYSKFRAKDHVPRMKKIFPRNLVALCLPTWINPVFEALPSTVTTLQLGSTWMNQEQLQYLPPGLKTLAANFRGALTATILSMVPSTLVRLAISAFSVPPREDFLSGLAHCHDLRCLSFGEQWNIYSPVVLPAPLHLPKSLTSLALIINQLSHEHIDAFPPGLTDLFLRVREPVPSDVSTRLEANLRYVQNFGSSIQVSPGMNPYVTKKS
jgi:hypothetical protein